MIDQISNATQKAHAIFYVTKTPNPPQKGEERKRGTIEKIQRQLDSQTEVWTIFNKPINSPIALKDGLINENEKESLKILNKEMKNILGKHYKVYKAVSTQAAFYGLSQALIPETDFDKKKQKFLEIFKVEELLLYKSHFKLLAKFISEELLKNSHAKIIQSNCNKALKVVEELQNTIKTMIEKQIDPIKFDIGEIMEERIEKGVEDEECERIFNNECEQRVKELDESIKQRFKECGERFDEQIKEDIERFKEKIKDSLAMLEHIGIDRGFNLNFDTDNGIDGFALGASIGGLVLLGIVNIWNPVGWVELGIAGFVALVVAVKAVWGFFDSDYKKIPTKKKSG